MKSGSLPLGLNPILAAVAGFGGGHALDCTTGQMSELGSIHHLGGHSAEVRLTLSDCFTCREVLGVC